VNKHRNILVHDADWQSPAITEQHAYHRVRGMLAEVNGWVYFAFPWATLFDLLNKSHPRAKKLLEKLEMMANEVRMARATVVVTVCQHVDLVKRASVVAGAGVTDIFWSHATKEGQAYAGERLSVHPFPLYPVHVSESVSADIKKPLLFSFVGAIENPCYLTRTRLWIWDHLRDHPKGRVVERGMWHYHEEVYEAQIHGREVTDAKGQQQKESEYRELMAMSLFSLCPSGSGPNTIRLWESIASGAIPVIFSDSYLPSGRIEEWEQAVVFCSENEEEIKRLPQRLESIAADPIRIKEMRSALAGLFMKYGPGDFIHDIKKLIMERHQESNNPRNRLESAFECYRRNNFAAALKHFKSLDAAPLKNEVRRSVEFFKSVCAADFEKNPAGVRILFVIPSPRMGATGRYMQILAEELVRQGAAAMVLADGETPVSENGVQWLSLEFSGSFLAPGLRRKISLFEPNIVYENGVRSRAQRAALEAVYLTGAHFAMQSEDDDVQIHGSRHGDEAAENLTMLDKASVEPDDISRFLGGMDWGHSLKVLQNPAHDRWVEPLLRAACYHLAEAHTAIWHPFAQRLEGQYGKPTLVVPPVCGEEYFSLEPQGEAQRERLLDGFQIPADCTVFFLAGAIYTYSEEFRTFLSAMNFAAEQATRPLCLVLSGRGWKQASRIAKEELSPKIVFRNLEEPNDARYLKMLQAADIVCSPGIEDDFTRYRLPSRLVKAMAMGKPILTAQWGFGESLRNGVNAFLTQGKRAEDWAPTILAAMDARKREEVGRSGKVFAEANFRPGPVGAKLLELFQSLIQCSPTTKLIAPS
jgi:glycosyltransferase involved in cell wall biosynthesis